MNNKNNNKVVTLNDHVGTTNMMGHIKIIERKLDDNDNVIDTIETEHHNLVLSSMHTVLRDLVFIASPNAGSNTSDPALTARRGVNKLRLSNCGLSPAAPLYKWQHPLDPIVHKPGSAEEDPALSGGGLSVVDTPEFPGEEKTDIYFSKDVILKAGSLSIVEYSNPLTGASSPAIKFSFDLPKGELNGPTGISQGYVGLGLVAGGSVIGSADPQPDEVLITKAIVPVILKSNSSEMTIEYTLVF